MRKPLPYATKLMNKTKIRINQALLGSGVQLVATMQQGNIFS